MRPLPPDEVDALLAGLSRSDLGRFAADLWAARGWTTRWEPAEGVVIVSRADPARRRRLLPVPAGTDPDQALAGRSDRVDALVVAAPVGDLAACSDGGPEVIDARALREILLYAVDRRTGRRLSERHLDRPIRVEATESAGSVWPTWGGPTRIAYPVVLPILVLLVVAAPLTASTVLVESPADAGVDTPSRTATPTSALTETTASDGLDPNPDRAASGLVSVDEVTDVARLARAHARRLERPYRWRLTYRVVRNGSVERWRNETVRVADWDRFRARTNGSNGTDMADWALSPGPIFADGSRWYLRLPGAAGNVTYRSGRIDRRRDGTAPLVARAQTYIRIFLRNASIAESYWQGGVRVYELTASTDPVYSNIRNVSTHALVSVRHGVVALEARYRNPELANRTVVFRFTYAFEDVTVSKPAWYDEARNRTGTASE